MKPEFIDKTCNDLTVLMFQILRDKKDLFRIYEIFSSVPLQYDAGYTTWHLTLASEVSDDNNTTNNDGLK